MAKITKLLGFQRVANIATNQLKLTATNKTKCSDKTTQPTDYQQLVKKRGGQKVERKGSKMYKFTRLHVHRN